MGGMSSSASAEPMSMIFALPVRFTMMLELLMSPCTISSLWRAARAARHSRTIAIATPGLSRDCWGPAVTITLLRCRQRSSPTLARVWASSSGANSRERS